MFHSIVLFYLQNRERIHLNGSSLLYHHTRNLKIAILNSEYTSKQIVYQFMSLIRKLDYQLTLKTLMRCLTVVSHQNLRKHL